MSNLEITAGQEKFSGYYAGPTSKAKGALVIVQEIYGVNKEVRRVVDVFAKAGFAALAPDLLWRVKPNLDFAYADRDDARKAVMSLDQDQIVFDIQAAIRAVKANAQVENVGLLALGWGGKFAFEAAAKTPVSSIACYYPGTIDRSIPVIETVRVPQLYHFAAHDDRTPPQFRATLRKALADRDDVEIYVYPAAEHGFANRDRTELHEPSAKLADDRTMNFVLRTISKEG